MTDDVKRKIAESMRAVGQQIMRVCPLTPPRDTKDLPRVSPTSRLAYFWDCPECHTENEISYLASDAATDCSYCGMLSYVTQASDAQRTDLGDV